MATSKEDDDDTLFVPPKSRLRITSNLARELPTDTLALLGNFYAERDQSEKKFESLKTQIEQDRLESPISMSMFSEDWNASQFWIFAMGPNYNQSTSGEHTIVSYATRLFSAQIAKQKPLSRYAGFRKLNPAKYQTSDLGGLYVLESEWKGLFSNFTLVLKPPPFDPDMLRIDLATTSDVIPILTVRD
ncbi:MAG: hypothetical protein Q9219_000992 [cf. Caloplaca sp. 3 TL-2023]